MFLNCDLKHNLYIDGIQNGGFNIRGLVLNRKSFRNYSPIGWEKWIFGILRSDVKNSCACAQALPFRVYLI